MSQQVALITGITGQDGSYLAEQLLDKGYVVHGLIRRSSTFNTARIDHLYLDPHDPDARLFLHYGDLTDGSRLVTLLERVEPTEVYHLGAQSHVRVSFDEPEFTGEAERQRRGEAHLQTRDRACPVEEAGGHEVGEPQRAGLQAAIDNEAGCEA